VGELGWNKSEGKQGGERREARCGAKGGKLGAAMHATDVRGVGRKREGSKVGVGDAREERKQGAMNVRF
jgi:hypothetical protein